MHKNAKHMSCEHCGKSFEGPYGKTSLDLHIQGVHLGQKKNVCDTCGKAFFQIGDMRRHIGKNIFF